MSLPLDGCRVLDLGIITAGAGAAAILADLGADVIKVESPNYRDPFRVWPSNAGIEPMDSPFFRSTNRNKRSISLNLKAVAGRDAFLRLASRSHAVVENFRRGVLQGLGLSFDVLRDAQPNIILASVSSQGEFGADFDHVSFGSTLEAMGGLAAITGYSGGDPIITGRELNYPDQVAVLWAASMVTTAVRAQRHGAPATHLDLSQRELTSFLCGDLFAALSDDAPASRAGNADPAYWLQDCYRTADKAWLAVSVEVDDRAGLGRLLNDDCLTAQSADRALRDWVAQRVAATAEATLRAAGLACARSMTGHDLVNSAAPLWSEALSHDSQGSLVKGFPFQYREAPMRILRDAAVLGEHTREVLATLGGYSPEEIEALISAGVAEVP